MATSAQLKRRAENQKLLEDKNVRAALEMISRSEGTNGDYSLMVFGTVIKSALYPSLIGKKNVRIPKLDRYPNILVKVNDKGLNSSAAGKYQIIQKTYLGAAASMGLTDFSPNTQDLIAVELIRNRGAIPYITKGDIKGALTKTTLNKEWASLAGAGYGQHENSLEKLLGWFYDYAKENPGTVGGSAAVIVAAIAVFF
jgi:muramidase (phage lysozyme)